MIGKKGVFLQHALLVRVDLIRPCGILSVSACQPTDNTGPYMCCTRWDMRQNNTAYNHIPHNSIQYPDSFRYPGNTALDCRELKLCR